jgi:hypothetical protein
MVILPFDFCPPLRADQSKRDHNASFVVLIIKIRRRVVNSLAKKNPAATILARSADLL